MSQSFESPVSATLSAWAAPRDLPAAPSAADRLVARWDPLLLCIAGYILTVVGRVHQLFPALEAIHPATLTGLTAIALYLWDRQDVRHAAPVLRSPVTKYLIAMLAWMALSTSGALVPGRSIALLLDNFSKTVVMFVVIAGAVRGLGDVERLAAMHLTAATVYAAVVISRFDLGSGDAWRLGHLYYYDANDFATFVVTAMPFGLYLLHAGRHWYTRAMAALALALLALAFVRTGSRGGFIALVAVTLFVVLRYRGVALRWRLGATALVSAVVLATASSQYWTQMSTILSDADYNRTDESGRMQIWRRGVGYMLADPVFGVGPSNFQAAEGMLSPFAERQQFGVGVRWNAAHNSYVQAGAELGIPGLVMFVGFLAAAFRALRQSWSHAAPGDTPVDDDDRRRWLTQALTASLLGLVVGAFFLSLAYAEMLYILAALAVGLHKITDRERRYGAT